MRCLGRTKKGKRCKWKTNFGFCKNHWKQPFYFLFVIGGAIIYTDDLFAALDLNKPHSYLSFSNNCKITTSRSNGELEYDVLLANWNYDSEIDISNLIFDKFSTQIKEEKLPINLYKCDLIIKPENLSLHQDRYDLILFGDYFQSLNNCTDSKICYSYVLNSKVNNNYLRNKEDFHSTEINEASTTLDIITGQGAEDYQYIINWVTGLAYLEESNIQSAIEYFLRSKKHSDNEDINLMLAISESKQRSYNSAEHYFKQAFKLNPNNCDAKVHYAVYLGRLGDFESSMTNFEKAMNSGCALSDHMKITNFAYPLTNLQRFKESQDVLNNINYDELQNIDKVDWLIGVGKNQLLLGETNNSIDNLLKAAQIEPNYYLPHLELGKLFGNLRQNDNSLRHLKRAKRLQPKNPLTGYHLAKQYYLMKLNRKALKEYEELDGLLSNFDIQIYTYPSLKAVVQDNMRKIKGY